MVIKEQNYPLFSYVFCENDGNRSFCENYTSIPEVFQDSGSEEEFLGFTSQDVADVAFGRNSCIE